MRGFTVRESADYVLDLLPADPDEAAATLAAVEQAFSQRGAQPVGLSGPGNYVFSHLRKQALEARAAILAAVRDALKA